MAWLICRHARPKASAFRTPVPLRGRLWRAPAQIADGRSRERDAAIDHQSVLGRAFEQAAVNPDGARQMRRSPAAAR